MGQLSQLVLLASIVASCISYSVEKQIGLDGDDDGAIRSTRLYNVIKDSTKIMSVPEPPVEPSESDFSEFPTEFMNKLIATLSPEELEDLHKPIILVESNLVNRDGDTDKTPCRSLEDTRHYQTVEATDGEHYFVITNLKDNYQPVEHFACDKHGPNDNKCEPADPLRFYGYCCRQHKKTTSLYVIPLPTRLLDVDNGHLRRKDTNVMYEDYTMVKKDVLMNSHCSCDQSKTAIKDYTCPNPESKLWV